MFKKKYLILIVVLLLVVIVFASWRWYESRKVIYSDVFMGATYFNGEYGYECSKLIHLQKRKITYPIPLGAHGNDTSAKGVFTVPVDEGEARQYCKITMAV